MSRMLHKEILGLYRPSLVLSPFEEILRVHEFIPYGRCHNAELKCLNETIVGRKQLVTDARKQRGCRYDNSPLEKKLKFKLEHDESWIIRRIVAIQISKEGTRSIQLWRMQFNNVVSHLDLPSVGIHRAATGRSD